MLPTMLSELKFIPQENIGKVSPIIEVYEYCILFVIQFWLIVFQICVFWYY